MYKLGQMFNLYVYTTCNIYSIVSTSVLLLLLEKHVFYNSSKYKVKIKIIIPKINKNVKLEKKLNVSLTSMTCISYKI